MQNSEQRSGAATRIPDMEPNKLQQAFADYNHMIDELAGIKRSLAEHVDMNNKLLAENTAIKEQIKDQASFLTRQLDTITAHRDRLNIALKGITTRYKVIRECFESCERDALREGLDLNAATVEKDDGSSLEEQQALRDLALHDPSRRTTALFDADGIGRLPPNSLSGR